MNAYKVVFFIISLVAIVFIFLRLDIFQAIISSFFIVALFNSIIRENCYSKEDKNEID